VKNAGERQKPSPVGRAAVQVRKWARGRDGGAAARCATGESARYLRVVWSRHLTAPGARAALPATRALFGTGSPVARADMCRGWRKSGCEQIQVACKKALRFGESIRATMRPTLRSHPPRRPEPKTLRLRTGNSIKSERPDSGALKAKDLAVARRESRAIAYILSENPRRRFPGLGSPTNRFRE
jgi:hypothetical protein